MNEPLYEATSMEILDGPNALVRGVARGSEIEGVHYLHVRDGDGREIATVCRYDDRGALGRTFGLVFGALGIGAAVHKHLVTGAGDGELMRLEVSDRLVDVKDRSGAPIGRLSNLSSAGSKVVEISMYGPPSGRSYGWRRPESLLTIRERQPVAPFDWAIQADGRTVARVANADDRRNVTTVLEPLDDVRRRLLAAFACSLVERRWTEPPPMPTGGSG